ncbi:MAG TPA: HAMP domain-containing sensor histidine kinase [Verrucomicrobiae bacterium]|nr:HAMP domain-containing sensor histidine kinase [Verrucomicrobiae bacterium]
MRKLIRVLIRTGRHSDVWPVALLLFAVVVPAICLLWFMTAAMRNERLAAREKWADLFRPQLLSLQEALKEHWQQLGTNLDENARTNPPALAFAKAIESGLADSVIIFSAGGNIAYPNAPAAVSAEQLDRRWADAGRVEYQQKDYAKAAELYHVLAIQATNALVAARAWQAKARCLVRAGQIPAAVSLVTEVFADPRYAHAADSQGRLIAANAELMVYELSREESIARRLHQRLMDYQNPVLAAPQRRFLMKELQTLAPHMEFPTLMPEDLATQAPASVRETTADRIPGTDLWHRTSPGGTVVALFRGATLAGRIHPILGGNARLLPPGAEDREVLLALPAPGLPGWRLAVMMDRAPKPPVAVYFWTAMLVLAAMGVMALLAARMVRREMALARLKNDLVATVSHELKTPLSSMRLLVDTLLDAEQFNEQTAREYLQLIASENERLSRLVENFLTFSRIERKKHAFAFKPVRVREVVDAAMKAVPSRDFDVRIKSELPDIMGDPDALVTALVNLLENACKHSEKGQPIIVRAETENSRVVVSVQDNGGGIEGAELKKIFEPFYQVDQTLSRKDSGCGLGLSIVNAIVKAHRGTVLVRSEPGRGSTFSLCLPTA